jgi:hypothetical protein
VGHKRRAHTGQALAAQAQNDDAGARARRVGAEVGEAAVQGYENAALRRHRLGYDGADGAGEALARHGHHVVAGGGQRRLGPYVDVSRRA